LSSKSTSSIPDSFEEDESSKKFCTLGLNDELDEFIYKECEFIGLMRAKKFVKRKETTRFYLRMAAVDQICTVWAQAPKDTAAGGNTARAAESAWWWGKYARWAVPNSRGRRWWRKMECTQGWMFNAPGVPRRKGMHAGSPWKLCIWQVWGST
jgi:hypothetical protein